MAELTPMKRQYYEIKQRNPDCLLFFRLGDFYEMFDDDARLAARELDLTLTTRDRNVEDPAERTPMCGVPYHSAEAYIGRLIAKGYKVAICEQMEDPALAKGLVERDIIRIITPGTVTESSMLEENKSNYLGAVYLSAQSGGTAFCDLSTGEFCAASYPADAVSHILNELGRFAPREAVCADAAAENDDIRTFLTKRLGSLVEAGGDRFEYMAAAARVCEQFDVQSTDELGLGEAPAAVCAAGALLAYLHETQKCDLGHIRRLELLGDDHYMELDYTTRRNLELTENLRSGEKRGSLLWVLDKTKTPMGGRMLRSWVERPLLSPVAIRRRLAAVEELFRDNVGRAELTEKLKTVGLWDVNPLNLFRITWKNEAKETGGLYQAVPNYVEIPSELSGVPCRILAMAGKWFPTGCHKVGASFGCLAPRLVTGQFDATYHHAVWPSTGNYCRGSRPR